MKTIALLGAVALSLLIAATATAATVIGGGRSDTLRGTAGPDVLYGKAGNDRLYGLGGNDRFYPGPGRDTIVCGKGKDIVFADASDVVGADCEVIRGPQSPAPPTALLGTRANPYPVGTPVPLGDGWTVRVVGTMPDATAAVLAENMFNDPPAPGFQFFIVRLEATYTGQGSDRFDRYRMRAVGSAAVSYASFRDSCHVIPDAVSSADVFTGGTIVGNTCWAVRSSDAGSLVMYDDPVLGTTKSPKFFALR